MFLICGWCQRYLGTKEPHEQVVVSHGMCPVCTERQRLLKDSPTLVISRSRAGLLPILRALVQGFPPINVTVDRRQSERRSQDSTEDFMLLNRRFAERRRGAGLTLT